MAALCARVGLGSEISWLGRFLGLGRLWRTHCQVWRRWASLGPCLGFGWSVCLSLGWSGRRLGRGGFVGSRRLAPAGRFLRLRIGRLAPACAGFAASAAGFAASAGLFSAAGFSAAGAGPFEAEGACPALSSPASGLHSGHTKGQQNAEKQ